MMAELFCLIGEVIRIDADAVATDQARLEVKEIPLGALGFEHVVTLAIDAYRSCVDFTDTLQHASSRDYEGFLTFDDRGFARPAGRLKLKPVVMLPAR